MSTTALFVEGLARSANFYAALLGGRVYDASTVATYGNVNYCDAVDPEGNVIQLAERLRW